MRTIQTTNTGPDQAQKNRTGGPAAQPDASRHDFIQFLRYRQAFVDERHPNLWENLHRGYKQADLHSIKEGFEKRSGQLGGTYHVLRSQPDVLTELSYKELFLSEILPTDMASYYVATLKRAINLRADYSFDWTTDQYDYTVTLKHQEGCYKAWIHQYWSGTVNGNVWLLINATKAVFYLVS